MNDFQQIHIDCLKFDKQNPRLPTHLINAGDSDIIRYLATRTGIERLMESISENGFFPGEAVVVTPDGEDQYTVIEGNRRLAALQLLREPGLVANRRGLAMIAESAPNAPTEVPCYVVESRSDTLQYLGFRHISGVQRWDPLAKARYLESLFKHASDPADNPERRYSSIAREIGSNGATVRRNLDALAAYQVIEKNGFYDIDGVDEQAFQFGTFYTATSNPSIASFVGIRDEDRQPAHPILDSSVFEYDNLKILVKIMFERDETGKTVLGESRNITMLGSVLAEPLSRKQLLNGSSLESAYRATSRGKDDFISLMNQALDDLIEAQKNLYAVTNEYDEYIDNLVSDIEQVIAFTRKSLPSIHDD